MRKLIASIAAAAYLTLPVSAPADDLPSCGGVADVASACTFVYQTGQVFFHGQNARVITPGVLHDDSIEVSLTNVTRAAS